MSQLHGSLEQWRALQAVVDHGGYAQAAEKLFRSQSTISYAINKLEQQLGLELLEVQGRKAELTEAGEMLLARSRLLTRQAEELGQLASNLQQGREAEIQFVVDAAFPAPLLMQALKQFAPHSAGTRVQLREVVLSGATDALRSGTTDLVITGQLPGDYLGEWLLDVEFVAVAHPAHALLHQTGHEISLNELAQELQVVIRDSGLREQLDSGWLSAEQRWTVTSIDTAVSAITAGLGFGWLPKHKIQTLLDNGTLVRLPLQEGRVYHASLYLVFGKPGNAGPATQQLAELLKQGVTTYQAVCSSQ
jgi:DNA-binding transcriptional LysR family regulator